MAHTEVTKISDKTRDPYKAAVTGAKRAFGAAEKSQWSLAEFTHQGVKLLMEPAEGKGLAKRPAQEKFAADVDLPRFGYTSVRWYFDTFEKFGPEDKREKDGEGNELPFIFHYNAAKFGLATMRQMEKDKEGSSASASTTRRGPARQVASEKDGGGQAATPAAPAAPAAEITDKDRERDAERLTIAAEVAADSKIKPEDKPAVFAEKTGDVGERAYAAYAEVAASDVDGDTDVSVVVREKLAAQAAPPAAAAPAPSYDDDLLLLVGAVQDSRKAMIEWMEKFQRSDRTLTGAEVALIRSEIVAGSSYVDKLVNYLPERSETEAAAGAA